MADEFRPENLEEPKKSENPLATDKPAADKNDVWRGVGVALLLHLIQVPLMLVTAAISLIFIGLSQLIYIIPAIVIYNRRNRPGVVKGLIIIAAITFLLNATCTALVFSIMSNMH